MDGLSAGGHICLFPELSGRHPAGMAGSGNLRIEANAPVLRERLSGTKALPVSGQLLELPYSGGRRRERTTGRNGYHLRMLPYLNAHILQTPAPGYQQPHRRMGGLRVPRR